MSLSFCINWFDLIYIYLFICHIRNCNTESSSHSVFAAFTRVFWCRRSWCHGNFSCAYWRAAAEPYLSQWIMCSRKYRSKIQTISPAWDTERPKAWNHDRVLFELSRNTSYHCTSRHLGLTDGHKKYSEVKHWWGKWQSQDKNKTRYSVYTWHNYISCS